MAVHDKHVVFGGGRIAFLGGKLRLHAALDGIVLELVCEIGRVGGDVDDGYDVDLVLAEQPLLDDGLEHEAADAAEAVDRYFHDGTP